MPEPVECRHLRRRLRELAEQVGQVLGQLRSETLAERRAQLQERLGELEERIDSTRAQLEQLGCHSPAPIEPGPRAPSLEEFGHSSMRITGKKALGPRRLLVALMEWDDVPAGSFLHLSDVHPLGYYEALGFGHPTPPFTTDPVNPASLTDYVRECSLGRFWFTRSGVLGPIPMGVFGNPGDAVHVTKVAKRIAELYPYMVFAADDDASSVVTTDELTVLVVENHKNRVPANRGSLPVQFTVEDIGIPVTKTLHLALVAFAGATTPFYQIGHELAHSLGALDMYNPGNQNSLLTLMGAYSFHSNDQGVVHLDAWHKLALGWCEPRRAPLEPGGSAEVVEISPGRPDGAVILWDTAHQASEYFLVERRLPNGTRAYDASFPGDGLLIWHVDPARPPMNLGAPNLAPGSNGVWQAGTSTPPLTWSDGTTAADSLTVQAGATPGALRITW
ncbi:hypothetical protein [Streptomyces xanthophaeus]